MSRRTRWIVAVVALVLLVTVVGPFVYINVIRDDPPARLSLDDVRTTTTEPGASTTSGDPTAGVAGTWEVADGSVVGYRIQEELFGQAAEAVGRSEGVTGSLVIEGTTVAEASFEVDMDTFESDESQRDRQFRGRIMEVDTFPTASFTLTEPIDLGAEPGDGETVTVSATGDLTLHGVTRSITIDLSAERTGDTFAASGSTTITFTDYDIDDPSGGPASVGEDGVLEVLLVFARA